VPCSIRDGFLAHALLSFRLFQSMLLSPADLAPGDVKSVGLDLREFDLHHIRSHTDPRFDAAYQPLWTEFGVKSEMERRETLAARFALAPQMLYEMVLVEKEGRFAAVRDHTAIPAEDEVVVHLSHNLVAPDFRRTGLAGWMRAFPVETAREFRPGAPITLLAEMEYDDGTDPGRTIRLRAYEKAGFMKVDPSQVKYHQPDFRAPMVIDVTGGAEPVPFQLVIRRVGREAEQEISGAELRRMVRAIYRMYGAQFRPQDMALPALDVSRYPQDDERLRLLPPTA
jgi:GNAT superfamily N-acetyltransferase